MHISEIPYELLLTILSFLDPRENCNKISLVCWSWNKISKDVHLWQVYHNKYIGGPIHPHINTLNNPYYENFKWILPQLSLCSRINKILFAIKFGHHKLLQELLEASKIPPCRFLTQYRKPYNRTIVHQASENGYIETLQVVFNYFKENSAIPKTLSLLCYYNDRYGQNALRAASAKGYLEIVEMLLSVISPEMASLSSR